MRQPDKTVPSEGVAEAKKQNRLSAFGSPYPDGGRGGIKKWGSYKNQVFGNR